MASEDPLQLQSEFTLRKTSNSFLNAEDIRIVYNATVGEIMRYRNREWTNVVLFTGAIAGIVGWSFMDANSPKIKEGLGIFLASAIVLLVFANIYYTWYAHLRLAECRSRLARLQATMLLGPNNNLGYNLINDNSENFKKGFLDHLIPFFIANWLLAFFGIKKIYDTIINNVENIGVGPLFFIGFSLVTLALLVCSLNREHKKLGIWTSK